MQKPVKKILLLGATGYIGGTVLTRLLSLKRSPNPLEITILVRSAEKTSQFNAIVDYKNLTAVTGDLSDSAHLSELAAKADFVINCVRSLPLELLISFSRSRNNNPCSWV
jgi:uncharacterized protein YbjT (DUF2867 family)